MEIMDNGNKIMETMEKMEKGCGERAA